MSARARRARAARILLVAGLPAVLLVACGRKLDPLPPLLVIPARVEPVAVSQEGSDVVLRFPRPSRTADGAPLSRLTRVTVWRELLASAPGRPLPPPAAAGAARERETKAFFQRAQAVLTLLPEDLDAYGVGGDLVVRDSLFPLAKDGRLGKVALRYAVTATRDASLVSDPSPLVGLFPVVPPEEPVGLAATVEETRVCLEWSRPARLLDGSPAGAVPAYAVYRREPDDAAYAEPLAVVSRTVYVDDAARAGARYVYTVRSAAGTATPYVLGPAADEVPVDTRDVFPPPAPEGLLVLREPGGNRLVWSPVLAPDFASYRVYRRDGETWTRLGGGTVLKDPSFFDSGSPAGARYGVSAVDLAGNEGARSESVPR